MKIKLRKSIGFKMAVAMAGGLFVVISLFSNTNVHLSEEMLFTMAEKEASKMSSAIRKSLDNAMLSNRASSIQAIIEAIGMEGAVEGIKIISRDGIVQYSKNINEIGKPINKSQESCHKCHDKETLKAPLEKQDLSFVYCPQNSTPILRNINPIKNEPRCHGCHGVNNEVLGKLLIDFSTVDINTFVAENRKMLILSAIGTLGASILICILVSTFLVKRPLSRLLLKMKQAMGKTNDVQTIIQGEDEIHVLEKTYDSLMSEIESSNKKIDNKVKEHQALFNVSDILNRSDSIDENINLILQAMNIGFHVEKCAVMLLDDIGNLSSMGSIGLDDEQCQIIESCLSTPINMSNIYNSNIFIADGTIQKMDDFLVVPFKAAKKIIGLLSVHQVTGKDIKDEELGRSFQIISATMAPHFYIGISHEAKKKMKVSPFNSFIDSVDHEIDKVKEYFGSFSLAYLYFDNLPEIQSEKGISAASELIQHTAIALSDSLAVSNETTRVSENTIAVFLPMLDRDEASDTISEALNSISLAPQPKIQIATFPEDGTDALELLASFTS